MKLFPQDIAKIEALLTDVESGNGHRAAIVKHGISDLQTLSMFIRCCRDLGVPIVPKRIKGLSDEDREAFAEFLRQKKLEQEDARQ